MGQGTTFAVAASPERSRLRHVMVALAIACASPAIAKGRAAEPVATLSYVSEVQLSPRLKEYTLRTPLLATQSGNVIPPNPTGQTKVRVLLPEGYDARAKQRYPVLYLFHGGGGNQSEWTTPAGKGDAEGLTKALPLIVVMPEGGMAGGYSDWYNGGAFGAPRWKTYHLDQLVPWIDARFRTIADRSGRATAGLSMGGGGLRYAALRPDLIAATASFSGDVDLLQPASDWNGMGAPVSRLIWGERKTQEVRWRGANGPDLAKNLGNTDVAIFSGDTGRPEGVYILQGSTAVHQRLSELGIAHQFVVYPGMTHSWPTWNKALAEWLPRLMARFRGLNPGNRLLAGWPLPPDRLLPHPTAFSYSSIEPAYAIHGWRVEMQRKAVEFSALEVAGPDAFTVFGSGDAVVRTPRIGRRGARVRAAITVPGAPDRERTVMLTAGADGRVSVPVRLGPANAFQQYSAEANAASSGGKLDDVPFRLVNDGSRFFRANVRLTRLTPAPGGPD